MKYDAILATIEAYLKLKGIGTPMDSDGCVDFWSFALGASLQGWVSLSNDDQLLLECSVTFGQIATAYEIADTIYLLSTTFVLPLPLIFMNSGGRYVAIGFLVNTKHYDETKVSAELEKLFTTALGFPRASLIGIEKLPQFWFSQS
jgi:hypothetical protein